MKNSRAAFTLMELLVVLAIIGILTSAMAYAVRGAQERARQYRTQTQMDKIQRILQGELLDIVNQRSVIGLPPVGNSGTDLGPHPVTIGGTGGNAPSARGEGLFIRVRRFREEALRVTLISRMPFDASCLTHGADRVIGGLPVLANGLPIVPYLTTNAATAGAGSPDTTAPDTAAYFPSIPSWLGRYRNLMWVNGAGIPVPNPSGVVPLDESNVVAARTTSSELLYQVLLRIWVDGQPATSLFRQSEFGDTDGDGLLEVLDAWGEPIGYRLQVKNAYLNPSDPTLPQSYHSLRLTNYSMWMNRFYDVPNGLNWVLSDVSPDSMSVSRTKVVVYSGNMEDAQLTYDIPFQVQIW